MLKTIMVKSALLVVACCMSLAAHARADAPTQINVEPGELAVALESLSKQVSVELVYQPQQIKDFKTKGIKGVYTTQAAVRLLLKGTPLELQVDPSGAMLIAPTGSNGAGHTNGRDAEVSPEGQSGDSTGANSSAQEGKKDSSRDFHVAQLAQAATASTAALGNQNATATQGTGPALTEIVVTAQKRTESIIDVPSSITAISGDRLADLQVSSLSDLANFVPGMSITSGGAPGYRLIEIRGLSTNYYPTSGPLVGTYIDDLPVGDSTNNSRGAVFGLDLNPYDIERVEVLKGPQGTLYGADTMGGLVKYALRSPNLQEVEVQAGVDGGYTDGAAEPNRGARAAVSLPLINDTLAVRVSGFYKYSAGYIDNVALDEENVNSSKEDGGRATVLWKPSDDLSLKATALTQDVNAANMSAVTLNGDTFRPIFGNNTVSTVFPQPLTQHTSLYALELNWQLPFAILTSSTGWSRVSTAQESDLTAAYGPYVGVPGVLVPSFLTLKVSKFVEEMRLASAQNQPLQWMIGGYFTKEDSYSTQYLPAFTSTYVPLPAVLPYYNEGPGVYKESAAFGNLTYMITERFDISGGARYSSYTETVGPTYTTGILNGGTLNSPVSTLPDQRITLWMTNARFHFDRDSMVYARIATGYRPGGGCPTCGTPPNYQGTPISGIVGPDKTTNYELGIKGTNGEHTVQWELAAFHIAWRDIQYTEFVPVGAYPVNGSTAVSNGLELSGAYSPVQSLQLGATLGYTDAHLTRDTPAGPSGPPDGIAGDTLPGSPRLTGSLTADYHQPVAANVSALLGGSYRYKDAVVNQFEHTGEPLPEGPQNIVDAYAGIVRGEMTVRLNASNIFNNRSYAGLLFAADPTRPLFVPVQPRTIGLSVDYRFAH